MISTSRSAVLKLGDIDERNRHPFDAASVAPVGKHSANEPAAVIRSYLAPDRRVTPQHRPRVVQEVVVFESAREVAKRPADVGGDHREQRLRGRREQTDIQVGIQDECRHLSAVEDVAEVPGRRALSLDRRLEWSLRAVSSLLSDCKSSFDIFPAPLRRLEILVDCLLRSNTR